MQYKAYIGESLSSLLPVAVRVVSTCVCYIWILTLADSATHRIYRLFFKWEIRYRSLDMRMCTVLFPFCVFAINFLTSGKHRKKRGPRPPGLHRSRYRGGSDEKYFLPIS